MLSEIILVITLSLLVSEVYSGFGQNIQLPGGKRSICICTIDKDFLFDFSVPQFAHLYIKNNHIH